MIQPETSGEQAPALAAGAEALILFVKEPVAGRVKTRLGSALGMREAAAAYIRIVETLAARLQPLDAELIVAGDPPQALPRLRAWLEPLLPPGVSYVAQSAGDLGARIAGALQLAFDAGAARAAVIGSDCPWIDGRVVAEAFEQLHWHDVVLGPSHDGGYYLVGARELDRGLFEGVDWSTGRVLEQTRANAARLGHSCALLARRLHDIDGPEEWRMFQRELNSGAC